jgi:hypothetical protein
MRNRFVLGQLDFLPTIISAGIQAGGQIYGAHMQETIAKMQKRTQEEILARQEQDAAAAAAAAQKSQATQLQITQAQAAANPTPKILGIDQSVVVLGGVGLALVLGVVAIVAAKSSGQPLPQNTSVRKAA